MRMIQRLARGGASNRLKELWDKRVEKIVELGGDFIYQTADGPVDDATYDDPHKPKPRRPMVDDDLEGWEPIR